ncbi:Ribonuclease H domain [Arabidopsis suecica]|uniref:Ribonuclease H domain n=1 Tax=Arabidopsis suecica TaxID=45249 RepID=A0A8T2FDB2_ARASU|nr:Ribonuclease H domain [Arabidopsis suecica]
MEKEGTLERDYGRNPTGKLSPGDFHSDTYNLYFKGLVREKTSAQLSAGFEVAIFREEDEYILFQMKGSLHDSTVTVLEAELMALKRGLTEAVSLGINHISICCDRFELYELVMGRLAPEQENIALLMDDVQCIRRELTSSIPVTVTENQAKFAFKLAKESISIRTPPTEQKACGEVNIEHELMFSVALCRHQFGVEWMKQHIEVRLIEGDVPRCPHDGCKSILSLKSCSHLLTPKLKEMWEHRIKEELIPVCDRFHCPNPSDLSCKEYKTLGRNPKTISRQCKKCQHMIKLSHKTINVYCRCGYSFCYTCGAQWKLGGCRHHNQMVAAVLVLVFFFIFHSMIMWSISRRV